MQRESEINRMWEALQVRRGSCIAFVGAGGKTTSMLVLSQRAVTHGFTALVTTTTKIWPPPRTPLLLQTEGDDMVEATRSRLRHSPSVALGSGLTDRGKVAGLDPDLVCRLVESRVADIVLCEADGAAGRPLKVHGEHEPVVPGCATAVAVVAGMDALGREASPAVIHRFDHYLQLVDIEPHVFLDDTSDLTSSGHAVPPGTHVHVSTVSPLPLCGGGAGGGGARLASPLQGPLSPATVADILVRATRTLDPNLPLVFILNKADESSTRLAAECVAGELKARVANPTIVITSFRQFIMQEAAFATSDGEERGVHATT